MRMPIAVFVLVCTALALPAPAEPNPEARKAAIPLIISYDVSGSMLPAHIGAGTYEKLNEIVMQLLFASPPPDFSRRSDITESPDERFQTSAEFPLIREGTRVAVFSFADTFTDLASFGSMDEARLRALYPKVSNHETEMYQATRHAVLDLFAEAKTGHVYWLQISDFFHDAVDPSQQQDLIDVDQRRLRNPRYTVSVNTPPGVRPVPGQGLITKISARLFEVTSKSDPPPAPVRPVIKHEKGQFTLTWDGPIEDAITFRMLLVDPKTGARTPLGPDVPSDQQRITVPFHDGDNLELLVVRDESVRRIPIQDGQIVDPAAPKIETPRLTIEVPPTPPPPPPVPATTEPDETTAAPFDVPTPKEADAPTPTVPEEEAPCVPGALEGLQVSAPGADGTVQVSWYAPTGTEEALRMERSEDDRSTWTTLEAALAAAPQVWLTQELKQGDWLRVTPMCGGLDGTPVEVAVGSSAGLVFVALVLGIGGAAAAGAFFMLRRRGADIVFRLEDTFQRLRSGERSLLPGQRLYLGSMPSDAPDGHLTWEDPEASDYYVINRNGELFAGHVMRAGDAPITVEKRSLSNGDIFAVRDADGIDIDFMINILGDARAESSPPTDEGAPHDGHDF